MSTRKISLIAALALGSLLACTTIASAQSTNAPGRGGRRMTVQQRVDRMASELKLNEEQKTKVTTLFETETKKRQELRADTALSREDRREKGRTLMQEQNKKLKEILTPEQFTQWQKMRPQGRNRQGGTNANAGTAEQKTQ